MVKDILWFIVSPRETSCDECFLFLVMPVLQFDIFLSLLHLCLPTCLLVASLFFFLPNDGLSPVKKVSEIIYIISSTNVQAKNQSRKLTHRQESFAESLDFLFWKHIQTQSPKSHNKYTDNFLLYSMYSPLGKKMILLTISLKQKKKICWLICELLGQ